MMRSASGSPGRRRAGGYRAASVALVVLAFAGTSCRGRRILYEWRDEPYLRPCYARGEEEARARMRSRFAQDRDIACRVLSVIGREAMRRGDRAKAREIARDLMARYAVEPDREVRSAIVALCLRDVGAGDDDVRAFLLARLEKGETPASAAFALAALKCEGAFEGLAAAYDRSRSCGDFSLAWELLGALWLLGDGRAVAILESALAEMDAAWPSEIRHMKRATCARTLASRLETLSAAAAAEPDGD
jgi:hypothetical protein